MSEYDSVKYSEAELGIAEMIDSFEQSYQLSCEHHEVTTEDLEYLRRHFFAILSIQEKKLQSILKMIEEMKKD